MFSSTSAAPASQPPLSDASYLERQTEEYQVLESIYGKDLEDLRKKNAWKIAPCLEVKLTLKPQQSMGGESCNYVQLDMVIKCPPRYPDLAPEISLINPKGLSHQLVAELKSQLDKAAAELIGEVMIWQLANDVEVFLHKHNKPPPQSFYDQMISNKRQQQEEKKEMERLKEELKRQEMEQEVLKRQEFLKSEESRMRKGNHRSLETPQGISFQNNSSLPSTVPIVIAKQQQHATNQSFSPETPKIISSSPNNSALTVPQTQRRRKTSTPKRNEDEDSGKTALNKHLDVVTMLTFPLNNTEVKVQRGKCLGQNSSGSTMFVGMDMVGGDLVAIAEWILEWRKFSKKAANFIDKEDDPEAEGFLNQVLSIEQELRALVKLNHPNLIHYRNWKYDCLPGKIIFHILMEYSGGINLSFYTHQNNSLPLEMLRLYTQEILLALQYLHRNSVVHKNLRASSIFIDRNGKVRLGDYSIDKRLGDLYDAVDKTRPGVKFSDTRPVVLGRGGQKGDIYQLGLLLLSLIIGQPLMKSLPDIPNSLPSVVQDFLNKCLLRDERLRWTAVQLLEHHFIKEKLPLTPTAKGIPSSNTSPVKDADETGEENSDIKEDEGFEYLNSLVASGQSRLASEFELLRILGKGGFGDVIKVKNKLDGRFYAIKRIPLNPRSKLFNKKMKREVKLLSRLNHENVVRYYCSWIEISNDPALSESSSSFTSSSSQALKTSVSHKKAPHIVKVIPLTKTPNLRSASSSYDPVNDIENLVPRAGDESVEWTTSFDPCAMTTIDSSSSSSEDEADVFGTSFMPKMDRSEDSIIFDDVDGKKKSQSESEEEALTEVNTPNKKTEENMLLKILYIQMEYCEKSTLRNCIDAGLCNDMDRVWRLFREIIEGLVHIHGKGMIHRDLKPVNIFLDSHDHVKIGDFGLATTDIIARQGTVVDSTLPSSQDMGLNLSRSGYSTGDLTGQVGTALYVSPEIMKGLGKVHYDQKVDIYSLGIIFFEMCYKSLSTGMERVRIINGLRQPEIILPEEFLLEELSNQAKIIRWLLNHEPTLRPTSKELLSSDLLPPPLMQETELSEILRSTICNPQSSSYRYMLNAIFKQEVSPLHDITYDQRNFEDVISWKTALVNQKLESVLTQVFTSHGALHIPLPLLMPKCSVYEDNEQIVMVMDHRGGVVTLPFDHRVSLARYVMRNNVQSMKRYALGKVFREKKFFNVLYNVHPKELTECSFDIITPSSSASLIPDAEVLTVVQEIINKYPSLQARNYYVRMNHMSLLKAVLLHCGIAENLHSTTLALLTEKMPSKPKSKISDLVSDHLKIKLSEQAATQLNVLLNVEGPIDKVSREACIRSITKGTSLACSLAKTGLHDIENIISHTVSLGLKLKIIVTVGLIYNPNQYSGVIFEVMCDSKKKKKLLPEVLAAGGRYDKLIEKFKVYASASEYPRGVGISLSFDRLAAVVAEDEQNKNLSPCDVLVCSLGYHLMVKERLAVARELRSAGFRTEVLFDKPEDFDALQENCRNRGISYIVIIKESEMISSQVKVQCLDKMTEKMLDSRALVDYLNRLKHLRERERSVSSETVSNARAFSKDNQGYGDGSHSLGTSMQSTNSSGQTFYNFVFLSQDSKKSQVTRRKQEAIIANKIASQFPWIPDKNLEVLALDLTSSNIKIIQAHLELSNEDAFEDSIKAIIEKLGKFRKYLTEVFEAIYSIKFRKRCRFIFLYSTKEETLHLLVIPEDGSTS
ncbi:eukaryotic translation initiation factor 2-alpha kinase 4 [Biomphalaria glabrata]|nr:eukaryotic translation initiation factor 2-alpha kinase 4 [Biomphalaria glabrata]